MTPADCGLVVVGGGVCSMPSMMPDMLTLPMLLFLPPTMSEQLLEVELRTEAMPANTKADGTLYR